MDLKQAEKALRRSGAFYDSESRIGVKIISRGDDGYGVETTVAGDRRLPVEEPMPIEEAIRLALAQLLEPRGHYEYIPSVSDSKPSTPKSQLSYMGASELMLVYKRRKLDAQAAWSQFITDTILLPRCKSDPMNAAEFFQYYRRF